MINISVVICTHNPRRDYFLRVLSALRQQTYPLKKWKLIIVDNSSVPPISNEKYDISWHPNGQLLVENNLGLTYARIRGIRESEGEFIVFVDDDNLLEADYLSTVEHIFNKHKFLGVIGAWTVGEFEVEVPEWAKWTVSKLGVGSVGNRHKPIWSFETTLGYFTPIGAGMAIRSPIARGYAKSGNSLLIDRQGNSLMSGGDTELALFATEMGYAQGVFPELKLTHLIPAERLTLSYLTRLRYGISYSSTTLRLAKGIDTYWTPKYPRMLTLLIRWWRVGRPRGKRWALLKATINGHLDARIDYVPHYKTKNQNDA